MTRIADVLLGLNFNNNGEKDLATGLMAPIRFYELAQRELDYTERMNANLTMISVGYVLPKSTLIWLENASFSEKDCEFLISEILELIINVAFKIKQSLRSNELISRLGVISFGILIRDGAEEAKSLKFRLNMVLDDHLKEFRKSLLGSAFEEFAIEVSILSSVHESGMKLLDFLAKVNL
ncbi:MAG: hypothetical protein KGP06_02025 [Acidobacteria bacterium]|nr:hypothetical protein [Acidobacteriota bacterium]